MTIDQINSYDAAFRYQLLARLELDCKYFLGNGQRHVKHLWANSVEEHIEYLKGIWNGFSENEKPEWLSFGQILEYERGMND